MTKQMLEGDGNEEQKVAQVSKLIKRKQGAKVAQKISQPEEEGLDSGKKQPVYI